MEYFKNYSPSKITYGSNEWSLSDYRRRVSFAATVEASYEVRSSIFSKKATTILGASPRSPASLHLASKSKVTVDRSDILGLAAGGQMYGARDLKLLIVPLISSTERRKYTVTQIHLGYIARCSLIKSSGILTIRSFRYMTRKMGADFTCTL